MQNCLMRFLLLALMAAFVPSAGWAAHAYALWGSPRYAPGFSHFDYVDPQAPKGGELRLVSNVRSSNFDKYNPCLLYTSPSPRDS